VVDLLQLAGVREACILQEKDLLVDPVEPEVDPVEPEVDPVKSAVETLEPRSIPSNRRAIFSRKPWSASPNTLNCDSKSSTLTEKWRAAERPASPPFFFGRALAMSTVP
jgi:hypothetical protein